MLKDLLKEVVSFVVGKQAEPIAEILESKKHVNEFTIAKKLDITINQTRNILYKLADHGLVSSIRKKDKKKGWYTYFWKLEIHKSLEFLKNFLEKKLSEISQETGKRETHRFYVCETCKLEYEEAVALLDDFICPECGEVFTVKDNSKDLRELAKTRERFLSELNAINLELEKEDSRLNKQREKEITLREKEKKEKRQAAAVKRKVTREKTNAAKKTTSNKQPKINSTKKVANKKSIKKKVSKKQVKNKEVKRTKSNKKN